MPLSATKSPRRRWPILAAGGAALVLAAGAVLLALPAEAFSAATLVDQHSGSCLSTSGNSSTAGTPVVISTCAGLAGQLWTTESNGEIQTTIGGVTRCLDANQGGTANGTKVIIWTCQNSGNQRWSQTSTNAIKNTKSGRCLDLNASNTAVGTTAVLWDCKTGGNGSQTWTPNGTPTAGFLVTSTQFDQMFPSRNAFYTYAGLVDAIKKYPAFSTTGTSTVQKQEAAAFLANVSHETSGLVYINEVNTANWPLYCDQSEPYGCPAGQSAYHGRGPIQLSWNFNYYAAGNALGVDLLDNPGLVGTDAAISWETGLWYWMTGTGNAGTTSHNAMVNGQGFGTTIRAINSIECNGGNTAEMQDRVNLYTRFAGILGVPAGSNLTC